MRRVAQSARKVHMLVLCIQAFFAIKKIKEVIPVVALFTCCHCSLLFTMPNNIMK